MALHTEYYADYHLCKVSQVGPYAKCHYAECLWAECRAAKIKLC
jgi:hypothetical protein